MRAGELKVRNEDNEIMTGNEKIGVRVKILMLLPD